MYNLCNTRIGRAVPTLVAGLVVFPLLAGCAGGTRAFQYLGGTPYAYFPEGSTLPEGPGSTGVSAGGTLDTSGGGATNPCNETQARKLVRISMRNTSQDYIHYFLIMIAYVNGETYPTGAVCPDDVALYQRNGYVQVVEGDQVALGNYCIEGPALYYFHRNGQFRGATGTGASSLASAIAPAQGSAPTYDNFFSSGGASMPVPNVILNFFSSGGASMPVPNVILFHNPGTGEGAALKISTSRTAPCDTSVVENVTSDCQQDSFYYVDQDDRLVGSTALGFGSGRRVPNEIQGTGCSCGLSNDPWALLAASNLDASDVSRQSGLCNRFLRGGRIEFVFVREDTDPPFPQLVWQVTDSSGSQAHEFDPRAGL
jgi:hypothetical protein